MYSETIKVKTTANEIITLYESFEYTDHFSLFKLDNYKKNRQKSEDLFTKKEIS